MHRKPLGAARVWRRVPYWAAWLAVVVLYLWRPSSHLNAYAWSNDEGLYLQRAALSNAGHRLYTEVLLNKPPLLVWVLRGAFSVGGQTLAAARITMLVITLLGTLALATVARQLWGRWAGLATAALWAGLPEVPLRAHAVMSDLPALSFAAAGVAAALAYQREKQLLWAGIAGAAYVAALLIHPLFIYLAPLYLAVPFVPRPSGRDEVPHASQPRRFLAVFVAVGLGLTILVLAGVDRRAFFTWVLGQNLETASTVRPKTLSTNWRLLVQYLQHRPALVILAGLGAVALWRKPAHRIGLALATGWLLLTLAVLLFWSPIWLHYLLLIAVPLIVVAGGGVGSLADWFSSLEHPKRKGATFGFILGFLMVLSLFWFSLGAWREDAPHLNEDPVWSQEQRMARAFLRGASDPHDYIVTDDPLLAFAADRLVPPTLTEASYRQIHLGYLTSGDLVASSIRHESPVVLFATGRLEELASFERWVSAVSPGERQDFGPLRAYKLPHSNREWTSVDAVLGGSIGLEGYALSSETIAPGDSLSVTLHWRANDRIDGDYHVFVHLVDREGRMVAQHDGPALLGAYPTSQWAEGLLLPDPHLLEIPQDLPPEDYTMTVGMYRWPSLERLPALKKRGERWPHDVVVLGDVRIAPSAHEVCGERTGGGS